MLAIFRTDIIVKSFAQIDLQILDTDCADGDDLVLFGIETGQLGIEHDKAAVAEFPVFIKSCKMTVIGDDNLVTSPQPGNFV